MLYWLRLENVESTKSVLEALKKSGVIGGRFNMFLNFFRLNYFYVDIIVIGLYLNLNVYMRVWSRSYYLILQDLLCTLTFHSNSKRKQSHIIMKIRSNSLKNTLLPTNTTFLKSLSCTSITLYPVVQPQPIEYIHLQTCYQFPAPKTHYCISINKQKTNS